MTTFKDYVPVPYTTGQPLADLRVDLLSKLASIATHAQELRSPYGNALFDGAALDALLHDPQVAAWLNDMRGIGLAPIPRA